MWYTSAFIAASLLAGTAFAGGQGPPQSTCTIYYGSRAVKPVRTGYHTIKTTITPTIWKTSARTTTITPDPTTETTVITNTETDTTTIESTDTFTETSTEVTTITTELDTQTLTETSTTTTSTVSTSTSIIPTTAGFQPVRSTLPNSNYDGAFGGPPPSKRSIEEGSYAEESQEVEERAAPKQPLLYRTKFPQSVECTKTVTKRAPAVTSTRTRVRASTITAPTPTSTETSQMTITETSTEVLTAQTTITTTTTSEETSTLSPSTTTTSTTTVTNTEQATATAYAQCISSDNFANGLNGNTGLYLLRSQQSYGVTQYPGINNALDCCNNCAADANCAVSVYTVQQGGCYSLNNCGAQFPAVESPDDDWVVSNGCGAAIPQ